MADEFDSWLNNHGTEEVSDDGQLLPGTMIGAYRVEAFLGKGGFAEAYSARSIKGERVAIKILHRLDEQSRLRFEREADILSQIHHQNIPRLLSFGSCGDRPYLVTEMLQARELPRTDREVALMIECVCEAVDALHKVGYVHRDIKPSNVLWRGNVPVLIDFGLACLKTDMPRSPSTISIVDGNRIIVGTAGYAAPEQFAGGRIDETTDVHAIGMLANACFDDKPPNCWRKIIDRATNSRNDGRFPTAMALARKVRCRHVAGMLAWLVGGVAIVGAALALQRGVMGVGSGDKGVDGSPVVALVHTQEVYHISEIPVSARTQEVYEIKPLVVMHTQDVYRVVTFTNIVNISEGGK